MLSTQRKQLVSVVPPRGLEVRFEAAWHSAAIIVRSMMSHWSGEPITVTIDGLGWCGYDVDAGLEWLASRWTIPNGWGHAG
jgi:hypothetical protein